MNEYIPKLLKEVFITYIGVVNYLKLGFRQVHLYLRREKKSPSRPNKNRTLYFA